MKKLANILFISAMLIFGTIGIIVKFIPLDASEIAFYRSILALLVISLYFIIKKEKFKFNLKKNTLILLLLSGIGIGLNWIFLFESYNYTSLSISTVCNYFAPIIVMVLSPIILKEKISLKQVICLIIAVVGLILIVGAFEFKKDSNNLIGIILSLLAAVLYAVVILINKKINFVDGIERTFFQFLSLKYPKAKHLRYFRSTLQHRAHRCQDNLPIRFHKDRLNQEYDTYQNALFCAVLCIH